MSKDMTSFMTKLMERMREGRAEITAKQYIMRLHILNDSTNFKDLTFLKDTEAVARKISMKAKSTQASYYTAISVALMNTPSYKKLHKKYQEISKPVWDEVRVASTSHEKSEKQKESMVPVDDVIAIRTALYDEVMAMEKKKVLDAIEYNKYMMLLLVSLYTYIPPRRNMDYAHMYVVKKEPEDNTKNYLVLGAKKLVYNTYKSSKHYGRQELDIPDDLMTIIKMFLKRHPNMKRIGTKSNPEARLLMKQDNTPVDAKNGITRLLNSAFGKKIGSTALRHIYLSDKYADDLKEREKVATDMGHSMTVQSGYIKF